MISLKKKQQTKICRTIFLISQLELMLNPRQLEEKIGEDQFVFRTGRGTRDETGILRIITERAIADDEEEVVCVCTHTHFINCQKEFEQVNQKMLMENSRKPVLTGGTEDYFSTFIQEKKLKYDQIVNQGRNRKPSK